MIAHLREQIEDHASMGEQGDTIAKFQLCQLMKVSRLKGAQLLMEKDKAEKFTK